jgi:hypothetical protein
MDPQSGPQVDRKLLQACTTVQRPYTRVQAQGPPVAGAWQTGGTQQVPGATARAAACITRAPALSGVTYSIWCRTACWERIRCRRLCRQSAAVAASAACGSWGPGDGDTCWAACRGCGLRGVCGGGSAEGHQAIAATAAPRRWGRPRMCNPPPPPAHRMPGSLGGKRRAASALRQPRPVWVPGEPEGMPKV